MRSFNNFKDPKITLERSVIGLIKTTFDSVEILESGYIKVSGGVEELIVNELSLTLGDGVRIIENTEDFVIFDIIS